MNNVTIIGQIEGVPQMIYNSKAGDKKLYKFVLRVPRNFKTKEGTVSEDFINVKVWNNVLGDEYDYFEQSYIGIEGRLVSFGNTDNTTYGNELVANKIIHLN
ncbi:single-stranded DNA-binding protein [Spiroplasma culicicola]|uniref:Single-stranded DNA-binding protein n=1 Tax=Spiroplasma culicicola AES-1 TaxID=1276246 RepID=W6A6T1_9MOLU|nr:single-stranded DNA-binding protein [Spiroplasma culicicola]AHI52687.1 single-stranded DNA-binding protein [Spiroplasma culicicola AES-1]